MLVAKMAEPQVESSADRRLARLRGDVERRQVMRVRCRDVRPSRNQRANCYGADSTGCDVRWRSTLCVGDGQIRAPIDQPGQRGDVTVPDRRENRVTVRLPLGRRRVTTFSATTKCPRINIDTGTITGGGQPLNPPAMRGAANLLAAITLLR